MSIDLEYASERCLEVITSCTNQFQLETAHKYCELMKRKLKNDLYRNRFSYCVEIWFDRIGYCKSN